MKGYKVKTGLLLMFATTGILVGGARSMADSEVTHSLSLPIRPSAIALDPRSGHVFLTGASFTPSRKGSVIMLDGRVGRILHTTAFNGTAMPTWLVVDGTTNRAFVALTGGHVGSFAVAVLDTANGALLHTVPSGVPVVLGPKSRSIVSGSGRLVVDEGANRVLMLNPMSVNNQPASSVSVLDAHTGTVARTVPLGTNGFPIAIAVDPRTGSAFITSIASTSRVLTLSPASGRIIQSTSVGTFPAALAIDGAAGHILVASSGPPSSISVLTTRRGQLLSTFPLRTTLFLSPHSLAIDEVTKRAFVLTKGKYNLSSGEPPSRGGVLVLDTRANRLLRMVMLGSNPSFLVVDAQRSRVFVLNRGTTYNINGFTYFRNDGSISVLDASTGELLRTIPAGGTPGIGVVDPQSGRVIVAGIRSATVGQHLSTSGYVTVIDASR